MNQRSMNTGACAGVALMAEREFAAFFAAVTERFGPEQAELAAEDWLRQLSTMNVLPASAHEWRLLSVRTSSQLATRVNAQGMPMDRPSLANEAFCAAW
jgi:hypothetical protein